MAKYTPKSGNQKAVRKHFVPPKPRKFPLTPHASGKWMKKIRGKLYYFGTWGKIVDGKMVRQPGDGRQEAEAEFNKKKEALYEGRTPRDVTSDGLTILDLCNRFLTAKQRRVQSTELSPRSFYEYKVATDLIIGLGKTRLVDDLVPADFESLRAKMAENWGPARLGKFVGMIRSVFKYAVENNLIDRPVVFGSEFRKPLKSVLRKKKTADGKKLFTPAEIKQLLDGTTIKDKRGRNKAVPGATKQLRAAILLGINAGLGNSDCAGLQHEHLDLERGWLDYDYPRNKTGLPRRAPLWPETITALNVAAKDRRPKAKRSEDANCVFLNRRGQRLVQSTETSHVDYVTVAFGKLLRSMKINGRKGLNFYSLRHTFATIGLQTQTRDRDAVKAIMGHASHDMLSLYDETGPSDERLQAVVGHVHRWLFGEGGAI